MASNRKIKSALFSSRLFVVFKCTYPNCNNFFTSIGQNRVRYCGIHDKQPNRTNQPLRRIHFRPALVFAALSLLLVIPFAIEANAAESMKGHGLGIVIDKSVLLSEKLKYKDIMFLDNSIPKYTGDFVPVGDDMRRKAPNYKNPLGYYQHDKEFRIFVDPPTTTRGKLPLIEIRAQLDEFHGKGQFQILEYKKDKDAKATETIRVYSKDRYVDSTCTNAIISAKNWKILLPDTINYLKSGCDPKATTIKTIVNEVKPITKHALKDSYKYQLEAWQKTIKAECIKTYQACKDLKQPKTN